MKNARRALTTILAVLAMLGLGSATAHADPGTTLSRTEALTILNRPARTAADLHRQIALQLQIAPGGKQTAANEVSYDNGKFVVTYAMPGTTNKLATPNCPSGWYCFYAGTNFTYPRGKLHDCGWQDLSKFGWSDRVESVDNGTGNTIQYIQHYDEGDPANGHSLDYTLFYNEPYQALATAPYLDMADHTDRWC